LVWVDVFLLFVLVLSFGTLVRLTVGEGSRQVQGVA
jgi:hypothetical protein